MDYRSNIKKTPVLGQSNLNYLSPVSLNKKRRRGSPGDSDHQLESIENIYTLKKISSKVNDKVVPWFDFASLNSQNDKGRNLITLDARNTLGDART